MNCCVLENKKHRWFCIITCSLLLYGVVASFLYSTSLYHYRKHLQQNFEILTVRNVNWDTTVKPKPKTFISANVRQYIDLRIMRELEDKESNFSFSITPWKIRPNVPRSPQLNISSPELRLSMVVFIKSKSTNFLQRKIARWTWAGFEYIDGFRAETIFIVGKAENEEHQLRLLGENSTQGDLLQLDQKEVYKDVVLKTLAGMDYAYRHFPAHWFYASADDDVMPDLVLIQDKIRDMVDSTNGTIGKTKDSNCTFRNELPMICAFGYNVVPKPRRTNESKWFLGSDEYPLSLFPPYCNGGWYTMPVKLAGKLVALSKRRNSLWIDDVWVTGLLRLKHFAGLAKNCFLNDTTVGLWTVNSQYSSFSKTGTDNALMTIWAQYAAKIYRRKYIHVGSK